MMVAPTCERCGAVAPDPTSEESRDWGLTWTDDEAGALLCPDCFGDPEVEEQVRTQRRRYALAMPLTDDSIVFINGEAKVFGDCTNFEIAEVAFFFRELSERSGATADWLSVSAEWLRDNPGREDS